MILGSEYNLFFYIGRISLSAIIGRSVWNCKWLRLHHLIFSSWILDFYSEKYYFCFALSSIKDFLVCKLAFLTTRPHYIPLFHNIVFCCKTFSSASTDWSWHWWGISRWDTFGCSILNFSFSFRFSTHITLLWLSSIRNYVKLHP